MKAIMCIFTLLLFSLSIAFIVMEVASLAIVTTLGGLFCLLCSLALDKYPIEQHSIKRDYR